MPPDQQILVAGTAAAPVSYGVPNAAEVILLAVQVTFDGTAAAGTFVPAVEIYSDGGVLIARARAEQALSAGSSASVTFAPGLDAGGETEAAFGTAAIVASAGGDTALVAAVPGHRIRLVNAALMAAGSVLVKFSGGTDLTGQFPLAANTGFVLGPQPPGRFWGQTDVGVGLAINLSAGVAVGGAVGYEIL